MVQLDALPVAEALEALDLQEVEQSHAVSSPGRDRIACVNRLSGAAPADAA